MRELTISQARGQLDDVVDEARAGRAPVYLTLHGRRVAAVIDAEELDSLVAAAEDLADLEAARAARQEIAAGEPAVLWSAASHPRPVPRTSSR